MLHSRNFKQASQRKNIITHIDNWIKALRYDIISPTKGGDRKVSDNISMTDEQFETYNKLLQLVDKLITELPNEKQKDYQQLKEDILLKK